jgi:hypothetical protein
MGVKREVMKKRIKIIYLCSLILFSGNVSKGKTEILLEETFENEQTGTRAGWSDYGTIAGKSFAGVSEESASPFNGGWKSFKLYQAPDDPSGCWITTTFPKTKGPLKISFDYMVSENSASQFLILSPDWKTCVSLLLFYKGNLCYSNVPGYEHSISLTSIEPHVWYRIEIYIPEISSTANIYNVILYANPNEKLPIKKEFKGLKFYLEGLGTNYLERIIFRGPSPHIYFDNLKVESLTN